MSEELLDAAVELLGRHGGPRRIRTREDTGSMQPTLAPGAEWLILVKPQFEVGRERVGKGGVVRDDALRHEVASEVAAEAARLGYAELARCESRLPGPKGNREIFLQLRPAPAESGGR